MNVSSTHLYKDICLVYTDVFFVIIPYKEHHYYIPLSGLTAWKTKHADVLIFYLAFYPGDAWVCDVT